MALKHFVKSQLVEVIEWVDDSTDTLVYRGASLRLGRLRTCSFGLATNPVVEKK